MSTLVAFVKLSRLHFLVGGFLMVGLGAALSDTVDWTHYALAQLMVTAAQVTAHYVNEYADFEADSKIVNRTSFSGGSGVLTSGALPRVVALRAGQLTTVIAVAAAATVATFSVPAALLGIVALAVSWAYSMPPFRLLNTGAGEVVTALTVAAIVLFIGLLAQSSHLSSDLVWCVVVLVPVQIAMLLAFELPDVETDGGAGKRVLAVRLGSEKTQLVMNVLVTVAMIVSIGTEMVRGSYSAAPAGAALGLPFLVGMIWSAQLKNHGQTTFFAVAGFFVCGCGLLVATFV